MERTRKKGQLLSRMATNDRHGENSPYFDGWKAYDENPFHPSQNPDGVIQMGLAENQVGKYIYMSPTQNFMGSTDHYSELPRTQI